MPNSIIEKIKSRRWLVLSVGLLVLLAGTALFFWLTGTEEVPALQVERQNVLATLTVTGEVAADTAVSISPKVTARILDITVREGARVNPGDLLVTLERDQIRAQLNEAQARAEQARAALENVQQGTRPEQIDQLQASVSQNQARIRQLQAALEAARTRTREAQRNAQRMQQLYRQELATAQEYEQAQNLASTTQQEVSQIQADISAAQAQVSQVQAQLAEARAGATAPELNEAAAAARAARSAVSHASATLDDYLIRSNVSGIVVERFQDPGELGVPGQAILRIINPRTLEVEASVEEQDLSRISVGNNAYIVFDAKPDTPLPASVTEIGNQVNPENGTVSVTLMLTEAAYRLMIGLNLLPGMTADVNIITQRLNNAIVLPSSAVARTSDPDGTQQSVVYVFEGKRLVQRRVVANRISLENYRILSGLRAGEWVAAVASPALLEKGRVKPQPANPETVGRPEVPEGVGTLGGG